MRYIVPTVIILGLMTALVNSTMRYPVGQSVPASVYTEPFDPCDPAYKFFQIRYGDPSNPKWQAAPDEWIQRFGNNERTMLLQTISELRVVVAAQGKRLMEFEKWQKTQPTWIISPGVDLGLFQINVDDEYRINLVGKDPNAVNYGPDVKTTDPNEGKK